MFLVVITNFINDLEQYHLVGLIVMYTSILHWSFQLCSHIQPKSFDAGLTHRGRVRHICVGNLTIIGSDNGLLPGRRQAIIYTNAGILLIGPLGTNFSEILTRIQTFSLKKTHLKMSSGKWRPFCLGLNVLKTKVINELLMMPTSL